MAGVSRLQYASEIRLIRVMCSGRVDLEFILRAFSTGQDGVFIGGCKLNECNYVTHGNYDALGNTYLAKKILTSMGLNAQRLSIEFMSGGDGPVLAQVVSDFSAKIRALGPIGKTEGVEKSEWKRKIEAARKLVPYIRLVERERLRAPKESQQACRAFWESEEVSRMINELIIHKLAMGEIMALLGEKPLSTGEISEILHLNPSQVAKYMQSTSQQGLVRYDSSSNCYTLA